MLRLHLIVLLAISLPVLAQQRSIEFDALARYDVHADYTYRYMGRAYTDAVELAGISYGAGLNYRQGLHKGLGIKLGLHYYRLTVDHIRHTTRFDAIADSRPINYVHPDGIMPMFYTSRYHYNTVSGSGGLSYEGRLNGGLRFITGGDFAYRYSFSQHYRIDWDGGLDHHHKEGRTIGFDLTAYAGLVRPFGNNRYYLSPKLLLPLYRQFRAGDRMFAEEERTYNSWLNGAGVSLAVGKYF